MVSSADHVNIKFAAEGEEWTVIHMSRLEYDALKLRAAQQRITHDPYRDSINIDGKEYSGDYLSWVMNNHHPSGVPLTPEERVEAMRRRDEFLRREREERARKAREKHQREQEERARNARSQQGFFPGPRYNNFWMGEDGSFRFTAGGQTFTGQHKTSTPPRMNPHKAKLARLAGVEVGDADNMKLEVLKKKAMRKCHPDTGGSHDKWLELLDTLRNLGIPL